MAIPTTTPDAIVSAVAARILGITPSFAEYQASGWKYKPGADIDGAEIRTFDLVADPEEITPDGIWGADGLEAEFDLRIVTTYSGCQPSTARRLAGADARDIWLNLHNAVGTISGMLPMRAGERYEIRSVGRTRTADDADDGARWRFVYMFTFRIHFKAADYSAL